MISCTTQAVSINTLGNSDLPADSQQNTAGNNQAYHTASKDGGGDTVATENGNIQMMLCGLSVT